eukprot:gene4388-7763_t
MIPGFTVFSMLYHKLFYNDIPFHIYVDRATKNEEIYSNFLLHKMNVYIKNPKDAQMILNDTNTFQKQLEIFNGHGKSFFGKQNILFANGEIHKRLRNSVEPGFYDLGIYFNDFLEKGSLALKMIEKSSKNGIVDDFQYFMQRMTLDVLGKSIFDHEFNSLEGSLQEDLLSYDFILEHILNLRYMPLNILLYNFESIPYNRKMKNSIKKFNDLIYGLIDKSKKKVKYAHEINKFDNFKVVDFMVDSNLNDLDNKLSDIELRDTVAVLFVAGHETTTAALSFGALLLAKHQNIQQKARNEIRNILGDKPLSYELIKKLKYIPSIVKETLRMYPSAINLPPKQAQKDVEIHGYKIPKGTNIWIAVYGMHHSSKVYDDPEEFKPERWLEDKKIPINSWIPFGFGPRQCLGNTFTLTEQYFIG